MPDEQCAHLKLGDSVAAHPVDKPLKLKVMPDEVVNFEQRYVLIGPSVA